MKNKTSRVKHSHPIETSYTVPEKQKKNKEMFNRIARTYDPLNRLMSFGIDRIWREETIAQLGVNNQSMILDLATGTGELARLALKKKPTGVVGIDPAKSMLIRSRKKVTPFSSPFYPIEAYGEEIPIASEYFTHAMIAYGIRNVSNRMQTFQELHRVLKPGGRLAILELSRTKFPLAQYVLNYYYYHILSWIGGVISGDFDAYRYLPESVSRFPAPEELIKECESCGFSIQLLKTMALGVTTLYIFEK